MSIPLVLDAISATADNETWTVTAISSNTFSVVGSRSGDLGIATAGESSTHGDITISIPDDVYTIGDTISFAIHNKTAPRYVKKTDDGKIINFPGGAASDTDGEGTWLTPRRMFENLPRTYSEEISFPNLLDHFRSIMKSQDGFEGSSFGINNFRDLEPNLGYGGRIREHNGNFPLLASMLMQRGISPLSIIDFAEQQYTLALSSVDQFLVNELVTFFAEERAITLTTIDSTDDSILALLARFENLRANDVHLREVYGDSTAAVKNWPVSLVHMNIADLVEPTIKFDNILGLDVIVHHDGHHSPVLGTDRIFDTQLAQISVTRSDGVKAPGLVSETQPPTPYARQLWFKPSDGTLSIFNVDFDSSSSPGDGENGQYWYRRTSNELREWNGTTNAWVVSATSISSRWMPVNTTMIRNSLLLAVEEKLYNGIHSTAEATIDLQSYDDENEYELAKYAAKYGFDTYAPDYNAADAFTWNYKSVDVTGNGAGIARWQDVYLNYFGNFSGCLETCRPNLEPWKLLGNATKPAGWDASYADNTGDRLWTDAMWTAIQAARPGLKICVDPTTDILLPPYVSAASGNASYALTNTEPANRDAGYVYGDNGPVESVWRSSIEYLYGCARTYFRQDPMNFLDLVWGYTYVQSAPDTVKLERSLMRPISSKDFKLHGEKLANVATRNAADHIIGDISATTTTVVKFVCANVKDNETIFDLYINGEFSGFHLVEGSDPVSGGVGDITFTDFVLDDLGIAFNLGDELTLTVTP